MTMRKSSLFFAFFCLLLHLTSRAQDKLPIRFGKVTPEDFNVNPGGKDSAANVLVIADFGTSTFEGDPKGWFTLKFKHSRRMKIIRRNGFAAATITIPLYTTGTETEKLEGLRASTYNLENGKVIETKLDDKSIFSDKPSKNWIYKKFTFPALQEGSVIEYTYTQESPFLFQLQPWEFQGEYPCLWSEYQVDMPNFFRYATLTQGFLPFFINKSETRMITFNMTDPGNSGKTERYNFEDNVVMHRWVMKNVPALKEESYTTTLANYISKIEFQLAQYRFPNGFIEDKMGSWIKLGEALLKSEDFGADLDRNNAWLDDDLRTVVQGAKSNLEKTQKIYAYVRDNFTCTAHSGLYTSNPLKTVYKNRSGNEAELNLLLTAMLRHEKIGADPVILSTRAHGFAHPLYPLLGRFNYVICLAGIDSSGQYLDASEPWLGFGRLPAQCYNGYARVLNKETPAYVSLDADGVTEQKITTVFFSKDEKQKGLMGHFQYTPGFNEACLIRQKIKDKGQQEYAKGIQAAYTGEFGFANLELDSLKLPDQPLKLGYDIRLNPEDDIFYFNPMLAEGYKENPFKAAERFYPVEMPNAMDESYMMSMEIPDGYDVDEIPKSAKVSLNEDEGFFEYLIQKSADQIQFRARVKLTKANYKPEDYESLREFFGFIVKKESEQIVFKKKKS